MRRWEGPRTRALFSFVARVNHGGLSAPRAVVYFLCTRTFRPRYIRRLEPFHDASQPFQDRLNRRPHGIGENCVKRIVMNRNRFISRLLVAAVALVSLQSCSLFKRDPAKLEASADAALARGDTARAIKLLDGVVHSGRAAPQRYVQMGILYRSAGTITGRLQSQKVLELGLQQYPDHAGLWLELGKTYYAQTFYGDAARCFHKVLRLAPDNCEARLYLGLDWFRKWKYMQTYKEYLGKAVPYFQNVVQCDPDNPTGFYKLAFVNFARGDTLSAIAASEKCMAAHPDFTEAYFLRGTIAFRRLDYVFCDSLFATALGLLDEDERNGYQDIRAILTDEEAYDYRFAPDERRKRIERVFWAERDPDLTTPLNERYLEHVQRMYLADAFYDSYTPRLRGWETERGKAVIKFGMPDGVGSTLAGGSLTGPMEMWIYNNEFVGMTLWFRDEFLNGNYMIPMDYRYHYAAQALYLDPPTTHYVSPYWEIPGFMDVITFRGDASSTDLYLAMKIDLETMGKYIDFARSDRFLVRTAFLDEEWVNTAVYADTLSGMALMLPAERGEESYRMVQQYDVPLDSVRVAFCLEDALTRARARLDGRTDAARYLTDKLVLSDILFYQEPPAGGERDMIRRGGKTFYPNPGGVCRQSERLRLYLEVYNLDVTRSQSQYEITYSIYEADDRPKGWGARLRRNLRNMIGLARGRDPVISQTLQRQGARHRAEEDLAVDIGALDPGDYILQISVRDHQSGEVAEQRRSFAKAPLGTEGTAGER